MVIQGFIGAFDIGCIAGASRDLPIMKGKGNYKEEYRIRSSTLLFTLLQNVIISVLALIYILWNRANYLPWEIIGACVGITLFMLMSVQSTYTTFLSGIQAFVPLSKLFLIGAILEGISLPLGAYLWGIGGLMAMALISSLLKAGLFIISGRFLNIGLKLGIFKETLKRLLSFGFLLRLVDYPYVFFVMMNVLWVTKFMSIEALALFSMARGFFIQVSDISAKVGAVYAMRFLEQAGTGIPTSIISKQLKQFMLFQLLVAVPLIAWAAAITLPFIVNNFIPKYSDANQAILILLMCSFFYVLNSGLTNPWVMEKKLVARGLANLFGLTMTTMSLAILWFFFERHTITDVAYSTLAGYYLYFTYMVIAVGKGYWKLRDSVDIILCVTLAATWTFILLYTGQASIKGYVGFSENLNATLSMGFITLLGILPITLFGLKKTKILKGWQK